VRGGEPERTCVGCRGKAPKGSLLRIVRDPEGGVRPDPSRSAPGRGAYVHRDEACVSGALRRGAVARALRTGLGPEEAVTLVRAIEGALRT
jgi:predicted RNA-binding protein YlxR (DUF448 family)